MVFNKFFFCILYLVLCGATLFGCSSSQKPSPSQISITESNKNWLPVTIEKECFVNEIKIPIGNYSLFPVIEEKEGKKEILKYILAAHSGITLSDVDQTGHARDGSFAVILQVMGVATLKEPIPTTRARYANNDQIVTIWVSLAGENREWSSEPLKITNPKSLRS